MDIGSTLLALEHEGWQAIVAGRGREFYDERLTDDALMLFPGGMVLDRGAVVGSFDTTPWEWYRLEEARTIVLTDRSGLVAYTGVAQRPGQPEYRALMTTAYVLRDGRWQVALHQQTPC